MLQIAIWIFSKPGRKTRYVPSPTVTTKLNLVVGFTEKNLLKDDKRLYFVKVK